MVEVFLEAGEEVADFCGCAEIGDGVEEGVVVFEAEDRSEFFLIEFVTP